MATFNQTLQTQIQPVQTVQGPSTAGFIAGAAQVISTGIQNFAQAVTEGDAERKKKMIFGKVEELLRFEEDAIVSGMGAAKARQKTNDLLRAAFPDDPESQLTLRSQLAGFRGGYLSQQVKQDVVSEQEQERREANELLSLIPKDQLALFVSKPPSQMTTEEIMSSFQKWQGGEIAAQQAKKQQQDILEQQTVSTISDINSWHKSVMDSLDQPLSLATESFFTSLQNIDIKSSEGTVQFQQAKLQARQAASLIEQNIRSSYALLIGKINDPKLIQLAESKRDAHLSTIENFVTDIEAESLDLLQVRGATINALIKEEQLPYIEAIGQGAVIQAIWGQQATGVIMEQLLTKAEYRQAFTNRITGIFDAVAFQDMETNSDNSGRYATSEDWRVGYGIVRDAAVSRIGISDLDFSDRLAKNYIKGANLAGDLGLSIEDVKLQLDDFSKFEMHWSLLGEAEKQAVEQARDKLQQAYVLDPTDGLLGRLLNSGLASFNPSTLKVEAKAKQDGINISSQVKTPWTTNPDVMGEAIRSQTRARVQDANTQLVEVVEKLKQENPGATDEQIMRMLPVISGYFK
jgi:hypothetical protein